MLKNTYDDIIYDDSLVLSQSDLEPQDFDNVDNEAVNLLGIPDIQVIIPSDRDIKQYRQEKTLHFKCLSCGASWTIQIPCTVEQLLNIDKYSERLSKIKDKIKCPNLKYHSDNYSAEDFKNFVPTQKLKDVSKQLYNEYDRENNVKNIDNVQIGDKQKRRWICPTCGRGWYASPSERYDLKSKKIILNCRFCERKERYKDAGLTPRYTKVGQTKSLVYSHPQILMYFDESQNDIDVYRVQTAQKYQIHWKCFRCGYEFDCSPHDLNYNNICPACGRRLIKGFNDYQAMFPEQSLDIDEKHNTKKLSDIHYKQKGLLHWKCHVCGHTFMISPLDTILKQRTCPKCNTLSKKWSDILTYIDTQEEDIDSIANVKGDSPRKVHWTCENGHKYLMPIKDRTQNFFGCPECRKLDWQFTDLLDSLTYHQVEYKIIDTIGNIQVSEINNNSKYCKYIQIENLVIRVLQEYMDDKSIKDKKDFKNVAESQGFEPIEIVETVDQINTDLQFNEQLNQFVIPLNRWCDNIKYIDAIVKWLIKFKITIH